MSFRCLALCALALSSAAVPSAWDLAASDFTASVFTASVFTASVFTASVLGASVVFVVVETAGGRSPIDDDRDSRLLAAYGGRSASRYVSGARCCDCSCVGLGRHTTSQQNNLIALHSAKLNRRETGWSRPAEYVGVAEHIRQAFTPLGAKDDIANASTQCLSYRGRNAALLLNRGATRDGHREQNHSGSTHLSPVPTTFIVPHPIENGKAQNEL